jgi:hypothetical protein
VQEHLDSGEKFRYFWILISAVISITDLFWQRDLRIQRKQLKISCIKPKSITWFRWSTYMNPLRHLTHVLFGINTYLTSSHFLWRTNLSSASRRNSRMKDILWSAKNKRPKFPKDMDPSRFKILKLYRQFLNHSVNYLGWLCWVQFDILQVIFKHSFHLVVDLHRSNRKI